MQRYLLLLVLSLLVLRPSAQEDKHSFFSIGLNVGMHMANKVYGERYNGLYNDRLQNVLNIYEVYQSIYVALGDRDFTLVEVPRYVPYRPAVSTGLYLGFNLSENLKFHLDINYVRLKAIDAFVLEVYDPSNWTSQPTYETGAIWASEQRFISKAGFGYYFGDGKFRPGVSGGGIFNATKVIDHWMEVAGIRQNLYSRNSLYIYDDVGGVGFGAYLAPSVTYDLNDKITLEGIAEASLQKINNGWVVMDRPMRLDFELSLRAIWNL